MGRCGVKAEAEMGDVLPAKQPRITVWVLLEARESLV